MRLSIISLFLLVASFATAQSFIESGDSIVIVSNNENINLQVTEEIHNGIFRLSMDNLNTGLVLVTEDQFCGEPASYKVWMCENIIGYIFEISEGVFEFQKS